MPPIIAFANRKGGSGKSTSAVNIAALLGSTKKDRVLLLDLDSQAHATLSLGVNSYELETSTYELLMDNSITFSDVVINHSQLNLDILPASKRLASVEIDLPHQKKSQFRLKEKLSTFIENYSYVLIDCPPALGILSINALVASNYVIVPMTVHFLAMEGLVQMIDIINQIRENLNHDLELLGILPTFYETRTNLSRQVLNELHAHFPKEKVLPYIRRNIKLAEAPSFGQPIHLYSPHSNGTLDYRKVTRQIKKIIRNTERGKS